jgi:hypothetical protein
VAPVASRGVTVLYTELWIFPTLLQADRKKKKRRKIGAGKGEEKKEE